MAVTHILTPLAEVIIRGHHLNLTVTSLHNVKTSVTTADNSSFHGLLSPERL